MSDAQHLTSIDRFEGIAEFEIRSAAHLDEAKYFAVPGYDVDFAPRTAVVSIDEAITSQSELCPGDSFALSSECVAHRYRLAKATLVAFAGKTLAGSPRMTMT